MFGISMWEIALILIVALIVLGPRQLAEVAQTLGKLYRDLQRMSSDMRGTIDDVINMDSLPRHPPSTSPKPPEDDKTSPAEQQDHLLPQSGEKSGPDFYADLLESSREEDTEKETAKTEAPGESDHETEARTEEVGNEKPAVHRS